MPNTHPEPIIDLQQIRTRNAHARHIVAGCASALPTLAGMCAHRRGHACRAAHAALGRPGAHAA